MTNVNAGYYQSNLAVTIKADKTPVTEADVETEKVIRSIITARFPDHGFFGEETGSHALDAEYLWLVDPIDGTKSFVREYPMFSTLISLMHHGRLVAGVSSAPAYGELAYAESGSGAWLGVDRIGVSEVATIEAATLSTGNLKTLATGPHWTAFGLLVGRLNRIRGYGDFLHYHLLAAGKIDAVVESDVNILDERLCDRVALINRGEKVLDGAVSEVKARHGMNTVALAFDGDGAFLESLPGVAKVTDFGRYVEVRLEDGADPQPLLREAAARLRVRRFEIVEPSLHDIFVETVTAHGKEAAGSPSSGPSSSGSTSSGSGRRVS